MILNLYSRQFPAPSNPGHFAAVQHFLWCIRPQLPKCTQNGILSQAVSLGGTEKSISAAPLLPILPCIVRIFWKIPVEISGEHAIIVSRKSSNFTVLSWYDFDTKNQRTLWTTQNKTCFCPDNPPCIICKYLWKFKLKRVGIITVVTVHSPFR